MRSGFVVRFALLTVSVFLLSVGSRAQTPGTADPWPTKEFEIRWYNPDITDRLFTAAERILEDDSGYEERSRIQYWDEILKRHFNRAADFYESSGLKPPLLPIETGKNNVKRYVVYAYDYHEGWEITESERFSAGYYRSNTCGGSLAQIHLPSLFPRDAPLLTLDVADLNPGSEMEPAELRRKSRDLFDHAAHELFHAIQFAYERDHSSLLWCKRSDGNGLWPVVEGMATAASTVATEEQYPGYFRESQRGLEGWGPVVGGFPYGKIEFLSVDHAASDRRALDYRTSSFWRYLAERFGGLGVFHTLLSEPLRTERDAPTIDDRYKWLNEAIVKISDETLYTLYPEFHSEIGSSQSRYGSLGILFLGSDPLSWQNAIYNDPCYVAELNKDNGWFDKFSLEEPDLFRASATCIELEWEDIDFPFRIVIEATNIREEILDQLHLSSTTLVGFGADGTSSVKDSCYDDLIRKVKEGEDRRKLECAYGKVFIKKYPSSTHRYWGKEWKLGDPVQNNVDAQFFTRKLGNSGKASFVLSNLAEDPAATVSRATFDYKGHPVTMRFSLERVLSDDGRKFEPPEVQQITLPISAAGLLNSEPDRYNFYGIAKEGVRLPGSQGTAFGTRLADGSGEFYSVLPFVEKGFSFGYTGALYGVVSNGTGAMSGLCKPQQEPVPIGTIVKSDEDQLHFKVDVDLCRVGPGGPVVVDSLNAEFVYAFGRRYFSETAPVDVITPGLELYIDQYLKELAASNIPMPPSVRLSNGQSPYSAGPVNGRPGETGGQTQNVQTCKCTCEEFTEMKKTFEDLKKNPNPRGGPELQKASACLNQCMQSYARCQDK